MKSKYLNDAGISGGSEQSEMLNVTSSADEKEKQMGYQLYKVGLTRVIDKIGWLRISDNVTNAKDILLEYESGLKKDEYTKALTNQLKSKVIAELKSGLANYDKAVNAIIMQVEKEFNQIASKAKK